MMIWPFNRKKLISAPTVPLEMQIKSLSLPQASPNWQLYARNQEGWDRTLAITEGYQASSVAYAAIEKRAKLIAQVPWKAKRKTADGYEHVENSPLQLLLDNPNQDMSMYELMYEMEQSVCINGNAFISEIKAGANNLPTQLWLLPARFIKIKPGRERMVEYYEYDETNGKIKIMADDMVQIKMPNPYDRWFGMPVLMGCARAVDVDREAANWQKYSLQNRGVSDLQIKLPEGATQEQADAVRKAMRDRQNGPANARAPIVSTGEVKMLGQTAVEMDFSASRRNTWTEIAAAFGVPLAAIGFTESVNLANAGAMMRQIYEDTIIPQLELYKRQLTQQLAREFGPEWIVDYDISGVTALQENLTEKLDNAERLARLGVPFDKINQMLELGIDEFDGWDLGAFAGLNDEQPVTGEEDIKMMKRLIYGA